MYIDADMINTGSSTAPHTGTVIDIESITGLHVDIRDVVYNGRLKSWVAASRPSVDMRLVTWASGNFASRQDDLATGTTARYRFDPGDVANLSNTSTGLGGVANLTSENRALFRQDDADYYYGGVQPSQDGCVSVTSRPGATVTGYKAGVGHWINTTNFIEAYITDDGTFSFLCVDKVLSGTRTSLLAASTNGGAGTVTDLTTPAAYQSTRGIRLATRISAAAANGVRLIVRDRGLLGHVAGPYVADVYGFDVHSKPHPHRQ